MVLIVEDDLAFDLMITDVVMPKMNGRELARQVCAKRPDLKILLVSGYTSDAIETSKTLGQVSVLLNKLFTSRRLCEAVRSGCQLRQPRLPRLASEDPRANSGSVAKASIPRKRSAGSPPRSPRPAVSPPRCWDFGGTSGSCSRRCAG